MITTAPPWNRPHIHCHWTPETDGTPITVPPPGTIVPSPGGDVTVYVGDRWTATPDETHSLAAVLRHVRTVTLVGNITYAGRAAKQALHDAWNAANKAAREAARPPEPPAPAPPGRCGRPRRDGQPCQQYAGWGADDPTGPCRYHGGSTVRREQQREHLVDQATRWADLTAKAKAGPLSPAEHLELLTAEKTLRSASAEGRLR
ncbi:hypothetical protein [Streptacidiphilus albus]|uniref:hypothetical protein n=1 Tax=Streptacidiphilus albus TaxID=105425 RepID=UPI00054BC83D|nr:hypothetical protein [Streptacidiphilus albus]